MPQNENDNKSRAKQKVCVCAQAKKHTKQAGRVRVAEGSGGNLNSRGGTGGASVGQPELDRREEEQTKSGFPPGGSRDSGETASQFGGEVSGFYLIVGFWHKVRG